MMSMEIARARRDSPEANVMNANQISLGKSVTHVMKPSTTIHHARVCPNNQSLFSSKSILYSHPSISECKCNPDGSTTLECDDNGDCSCKEGFSGSKCSKTFPDGTTCFDDSCYLITDEKLPFDKAAEKCIELGGKLFEPMNSQQDKQVLDYVRQKYSKPTEYYIGIFHDDAKGK